MPDVYLYAAGQGNDVTLREVDVAGSESTRTVVGRSFDLAYNVEAFVGRSFDLTYNVEAFVGRSFQLSYQIHSGGAVAFTRSAARTIKVQADNRAFLQTGKFWDMSNPKQPRGLKDPGSTIDLTFDWSDWFADIGGGVPAKATYTVATGLVQAGDILDGCFASVVVSGGLVSTVPVPVTCKIETADVPPRKDERTVYLTIEDR